MSDQPTPAPKKKKAVDPLVGKIFGGRYKLLDLVARGGMGKIYKAEQQPLGRVVALKVLDVTDDGDGEFRERFFLEASHCSKLSHPNTVRIFDYGETEDGVYYMTMEWLEGSNLQLIFKRDAPLAPMRAVAILKEIGGALAEAHSAGIVHRDLKPANVLVTEHGADTEFCKVVDFGLVKELGMESELSKTGHVLGSPMYMSPEQVQGGAVDGRTDIYAAGMILYALLTGKTAFKKGNTLAVLMSQVNKAPPPFAEAAPGLNLPASLEWVTMTAIQKEPSKRFATFEEMLRALKACEKELRGEWVGPIEMSLDADGNVRLPDGLVVSEEIRVPAALRQKAADVPADEEDTGGNTTLVTHPATLAVGGLGFMLAAGGVLVLGALIVVVAVLWMRTSAPDPAPTPAPVVVSPEPAAAPERVDVVLTTDPAGAEVVKSSGAVLGSTPFTYRLKEGEALTVTVKLEGYHDQIVELSAANPKPVLTLHQKRAKRRTTTKPAPAKVKTAPAPAPEPVEPKPKTRKPLGDVRNPFD